MRIYHLPDGRTLQGGPFELGEFRYPANWLDLATPTDLAEREITVEELPDPPPPDPTVPNSVSPYQARVALLQAGLLATVDAFVNGSGNEAAKIAWEYANSFERNSPFITGMAGALGLTDAQVDALFVAASQVV